MSFHEMIRQLHTHKRLAITKFIFTIIISICWSTLSIANNVQIAVSKEFPNYVDDSVQHLCEDGMISLNFSNVVISNINQDFISSSLITCLDLTDSNIQNIGRGAFNKLPNLKQLFLSNNRFDNSEELFKFGGHNKLQVLVMNSAIADRYSDYCSNYNYNYNYNYINQIRIFGEYPNLEVLSLRQNCFNDLQFILEKNPLSKFIFASTMAPIITQSVPFPKLKILDLSENRITGTNFVTLLSNSLHFLDLHDNLLNSLYLNGITNKLFALNVDNNRFNYISSSYNMDNPTLHLSLAGLEDLHYLSVSTNKIDNIEWDAFQDNTKLRYLNLSANYINFLYPEIFSNLQYLNILDLSNNKLENVPQILNEIGIINLYINGNNITKLMSHTFKQMPKLTKLLLGDNQINEIDVNAFAYLSALQELDLSRNMLSSLPEGWTESFMSLKYLDLSDNQLTSLESLSLTNALPLIEIYLMMNTLEYLDVRYFENLPQNLTINLIMKSSFAKWKQNVRNEYGQEF